MAVGRPVRMKRALIGWWIIATRKPIYETEDRRTWRPTRNKALAVAEDWSPK